MILSDLFENFRFFTLLTNKKKGNFKKISEFGELQAQS